jgi:hypothetical protein
LNTKMLTKARSLWNNPEVSRELNRANMRKWVNSVKMLGSNWLLAVPVEKKVDRIKVR